MKSEQYDKLTDEEKRDQVAKAAGVSLEDIMTGKLPDYLNDLNACHEMEQLIYKAKRVDDRECGMIDYCDAVGAIVSASGAYRQQQAVHATAADRCKAFVLIMTKEEGDD